MLFQLLDIIQREKVVSLIDLARRFHIDPLALEAMLARGVKKGLIQRHARTSGCKTSACHACPEAQAVYYQDSRRP